MIHFVAKFVGYAGGGVIVTLAGRYGFITSDDVWSGSIAAFAFGLVAFAGTFGPMIASRVGRTSKLIAAPIMLTAIAALAGNIIVDVQAMRSRGEEQTAQRTSVADTVSDARRSLAVAEKEREGLKFTPGDDAAVAAAKARAAAATQDKEAARQDYDTAKQASDTECLIRGKVCIEKEKITGEKNRLWHEKEQAESAALAAIEAATQNKALTDRAAKLDAQIAVYHAEIQRAGPVRETNSPGKVLANLFGRPETEATKLVTWQTFVMMTVAELFIMALLLGAEEMERHEKRSVPVRAGDTRMVVRREYEEGEPGAETGHEEAFRPEGLEAPYTMLSPVKDPPSPLSAPPRTIEPPASNGIPRMHAAARKAAEVAQGAPAPRPFPTPVKPRLIASTPVPAGNVLEVMVQILEPGQSAGDKVAITDLHAAYAAVCAVRGKEPVSMSDFVVALSELCARLNIEVRDTPKGVFLLKVRIAEIGDTPKQAEADA